MWSAGEWSAWWAGEWSAWWAAAWSGWSTVGVVTVGVVCVAWHCERAESARLPTPVESESRTSWSIDDGSDWTFAARFRIDAISCVHRCGLSDSTWICLSCLHERRGVAARDSGRLAAAARKGHGHERETRRERCEPAHHWPW